MFLLASLQSPINIGMILRTAEVFGHGVTIYDPTNVMQGGNLDWVADFGCGSFGRRPPFVSPDLSTCLDRAQGRVITTAADGTATPLGAFVWQPDDCIVFGNEYDGILKQIETNADATVWVPVPKRYLPKPKSKSPIDPDRSDGVVNDGSTSLNVAATAAIIAHAIYASRTDLGS
ncbi:TrmH family RNA methyltransferase [Pseudosulfitobacter koreensis]|uniref:TrmH family RNA methyltransferase n=1 Tax=Pseudosulfitobacter koreensis TaxID=2968472 RepID=A0ABT1YWI2_9RHOB|nr:TrmH family RNA methyltransferase [Pseudosulfitobacter koreense]MCR8825248.1 TrmH family RNA methyltransferase [Pseudosulfitobacter koreense]